MQWELSKIPGNFITFIHVLHFVTHYSFLHSSNRIVKMKRLSFFFLYSFFSFLFVCSLGVEVKKSTRQEFVTWKNIIGQRKSKILQRDAAIQRRKKEDNLDFKKELRRVGLGLKWTVWLFPHLFFFYSKDVHSINCTNSSKWFWKMPL